MSRIPKKHRSARHKSKEAGVAVVGGAIDWSKRPPKVFAALAVLLIAVIGTVLLIFSKAAVACTTTVSSVSAAQTAVNNASSGDTVCMVAGSYGAITLTGNHTANVTFEPDPSLDPNAAGKVTFTGINVAGNYITVHNFYSTGAINVGSASPYPGYNHDVIDHNAVGPTSGYGIDILSSAATSSSFITISNNIIHDTSSTGEGDAIRLDGWNNVAITGNDIYNIKECAGNGCHTDTLQSYNEGLPTNNLTISKNYIHDNVGAQGLPFLKDGDISNVNISDNLSLRNTNTNGQVTGVWVDENINGLSVTNNTYQGTSGSIVQSDGSASNPTIALNHNVFDNFNIKTGSSGKAYATTEDYNIYTGNNQYTFGLGPHSSLNSNPGYKCAPNCGVGAIGTATQQTNDDYRLASNPNGIGIDWSPASQNYGPVNTAAASNNYYVATNGSDSNPCSQAAPCLTFNKAYTVASPGDTVLVASGVYNSPFQNAAGQSINGEVINWDATKANASGNVIFQPAAGASVTVNGNIRVYSSHVTFENMSLVNPANANLKGDVEAFNYDPNGVSAGHNVGFITFQNIIGRNFNIYATHDVSVIGGSFGPSSACQSGQPGLTQYGGGNNALRPQPGAPDPSNITIDGVTVHNIMSYDTVGCHTEGLAIFSGSNVTVKNSKFYGNDIYDILAQANSGSGSLGKITIQNNWFAQTTNGSGSGSGSWGVELDSIASNVAIDNNSFNYPLLFQDPAGSLSNVSIVGNILAGPVAYSTSSGTVSSMCGKTGVTAQYNFTASASGQTCSTATNTSASSTGSFYANTNNDSTINYSLIAGSAAIGYVPTAASPVTNDIDYHCRPAPSQTNMDAGASELNATGSCGNPITGGGTDTTSPTVSLTAPTNGVTVSGSAVAISANASDNVGVASVQFQLDGANLGLLDTASPYIMTWDSTAVADGSHALTAIAKDAAGNTTTSSTITVAVSNNVSTPGCTTTVTTAAALSSAVNNAASGATVCVDGSAGPYANDGTNPTSFSTTRVSMSWTGGSSRNSKVTVKPLNATPVVFTGGLLITGSQIEVQNISMAGQLYEIDGPAHDIQMTNVTAGHFIIDANGTSVAQNITIKGGSIGPWHSYPDNWIVSNGGTSPNKNITLDGVTIHDMTISAAQLASGTHFECLQVWAADGLTIQNSTFKNCSVFDMFIQAAGSGQPPAPTNVMIQNNFLDCCSLSDGSSAPNYALQLPTDHGEGTWKNVTIRNNSGDSGIIVGSGPSATFSGDSIENNILPKLDFNLPTGGVPSGLKVDYNEWYSGSKLGTHDLTGATTGALFLDFAGLNFHLANGAPVIGKADPTAGSYPSTDIDGNTRPAANGPDIGANEPVGTAPPTCTTGILQPPSAIHETASNYTSISLAWTAPAPTTGCTITGYKVFRDGSQIATVASGTSYTDSNASFVAGNSYNYSLQATDSGPNNSAQSATVAMTTKADDQAPNLPTLGGSPAVTASSVTLTWSAVTDNPNSGGLGVKGYNVYRGTSPSTISSSPLNSTPLTSPTYVDSTVIASTSYSYVVTALDNALPANESAPSNIITTTTSAPTCSGTPTTPGVPTKTASTITSISLNWTASTASAGCTLSGYHIYRADVGSGTTPIATVSSGTSYTDSSSMSPNTNYTYTIKAFDTSSHSSSGAAATLSTAPDTTAPSAPGSVVATATGSAQVNLGWTASTDNVGVAGYNIYRSDKPSTILATVNSTTLNYSDNAVAASSTYSYQVNAFDGVGNTSTKSGSNSVTTPAATDKIAPSAPSNVTAPAIATESATVTWTPSTDNVGVAGYHVYINNVFDTDSATSSVTLTCLAPIVNYTITVTAFDAAGNISSAGNVPVQTTSGGLSGDVNCDTHVNSTDLFTVLRNWQMTAALPTNGDIDGNDIINSNDLFSLLRNWGK